MARLTLNSMMPIFKKVLLFKGLSDEQLRKIIGIMHLKDIKNNELITREGANDDSLFILLKGEVEISKSVFMLFWGEEMGHQEKSLIHLSEKDYAFFGEMALFEDEPQRSASIKALKPCTLAVIEKTDLLKILNKDAAIGSIIYKNIATELTRRLVKANKDVMKLTTAFSLALEGD